MIRATPRVQARARQIAEVTGAHRVLSFASAEPGIQEVENVHAAISSEALTAHKCVDCGTESVTASVVKAPHCINCGSHHLKTVDASAKVPEHIKADADLAGIPCKVCATLTVTDTKVLASLESIHCSVCGTHLKHQATLSSEETTMASTKTVKADANGVALPEAGTPPDTPSKLGNEGTPPTLVMKTNDADPQTPNDHGTQVQAEAEDDKADDKKDESKEEEKKEEAAPVAAEAEEKKEKEPKEEEKKEEAAPVSAEAEDDKKEEPKEEEKKEEAAPVAAETQVADAQTADADETLTSEDLDDFSKMGDGFDDTVTSWTDDIVDDVASEDDLSLAVEMTGDASDVTEDIMESVDDLPMVDQDLAASEPDPFAMDEVSEGEPILDVMDLDDTVSACYLIQAGNSLIAMKGHYSVGKLTQQRAGRNADVMFTDGFSDAFMTQANRVGLRKALASFKFNPVNVRSSESAALKRQTAAMTSKVQAEVKKYTKVQADSLALAAAGISRGLFKGVANPLKVAIEAEFSRLGVRNPGSVAASLLTEHGMEYAAVLCAQAQKIAARSETARRELADMLDLVSDEPAEDVMCESDDTDGGDDFDFDEDASFESAETVAARLLRPAVPSEPSRQTAALFKPHDREARHESIQANVKAILSGRSRVQFGDE